MQKTSVKPFENKSTGRLAKYMVFAMAAALLIYAPKARAANKFWGGTGTWTTANTWSLTSGGTLNQTWAAGDTAQFDVASSTITYVTGTQVAGITANQNVTVTAAGTFSTGATVMPISVASGMTFNFAAQNLSTTAGTGISKSGAGTLFMANGNSYLGGFTLTAGIMVAGGTSAMGAGGPLAINGGTIAGSATRDFSGKFTGITVGGDFQLGALASAVPLSLDAANLTFNNTVSLGAATRTVTIGGTGTYTLGGVISGGAGAGLTVNALAGASGLLSLTVANTYSGNTTISSGATLSIGSDTATLGDGTGTLVLAGGTLSRASQSTAQTFANPISVTASSTIAGNPGSGSRIIPFSSSSVSGSAGTLTVSNTATSGSGSLQVRFFGAFAFSQPVSVGKAFSGSSIYLQFYNNVATGDQTWSGLISGNGILYKNVGSGPGGNVILSSPNIYTGGTEIRGGFFGLGTDNALGFGNVTVGFDSNPLGLYANGAARQLTNDVVADPTISTSTNLQIKGSQNLTLSGRLVITNIMQLTISNTALTTFSGAITNIGSAGGITKTGPGKMVFSGATAYTGSTRVAGGTLALTGAAVPAATTNLAIFGGATLDVSGLSSTLTLANSQSLQVASPTATATLVCGGTAGLTMGSTSPLVLAYSNSIPSLTVTGGVLAVSSGSPVIITVANGGFGLPAADYKLIAAGPGGSVAGSAPAATLTINGDNISGAGSLLVISNSELYLRVTNATIPPSAPVANAASATNVITFTASWNSAVGALGYHLDVSTASDFSSFVPGYNDLDVGSVTSYAVTGLNPATIYYYQVRATNAFGFSASSTPAITVTTLVAPYVWNAGNGNWGDASSWQYANVPGNGVLVGFTGAGGNAANNLTGLLLNSMVFSNGAGAYTVSGNGLVVSNGILNSSTAGQTISAPLTLGLAETFNAAAGALTFSGPVINAGNTLTLSATASVTNSGSISGTGGLVKSGAGTLALTGNNTYSGATTISAGTVQIAGGAALTNSYVTLANAAGTTLGLSDNETIASLGGGGVTGGTIALGANNLSVSAGTNGYGGAVTGAGKLVKTGTGMLSLTNAGAIGSSCTLRVEGGTMELYRLGGASLVGIIGSGNTVELAGGNLQLSASAQANFGVIFSALNVSTDSTITFNRTNGSASSQSPVITAPLSFTANANLTFAYGPFVQSGSSSSQSHFAGAANTLLGDATFTLGASNYNVAIDNVIGESGGSHSVTKTGLGTLTLGAVNTYSGNTTISAGPIAVGSTATFGNGAGTLILAGGSIVDTSSRAGAPIGNPVLMTTDATIYGDSTLTNSSRIFPFSGLINMVAGTLSIRNEDSNATSTNNEFRVRLTAGGLNLTQPIAIGSPLDLPTTNAIAEIEFYGTNTDAPQIVSGNISGSGSLFRAFSSGGTTILTGSNTYSGGTFISGGTLLINSTNGGGTGTNIVAVTSPGALGGTGIIAGPVTNSVGSTLKPGLGGLDTSTLTISNTLGLAGNTLFTVNRTNAQNAAKIAGLSAVTYGGTLTLTNVGDPLQPGDTFTLFSATAYAGSFTNVVLPSLTSGLIWVTNNLAVNGSVSVSGATALALTSSENPAGYLDTLTFTATVTPTAATGSVIFFNGATPFSTNALVSGSATSTGTSSLPRGTETIAAVYSGDANYSGSLNALSQVVTNHPPVAGNVSYNLVKGLTLKIKISDLLATVTDADGDTNTLSGVSASTNGITLGSIPGYLTYTNANAVNDAFTYTVSDGFGGSATASVTIVSLASVSGQSTAVVISGGVAVVSFAGIPGYTYNAQRSTDLVNWTTILTTNLSSPLFSYPDTFSDLGSVPPAAFYRLQYQP